MKTDERFEKIIKAIEQRVIDIGTTKIRLRVLSIHPSLLTGESQTEATLRLALRPDNGTQLEIVNESSFEARLSELGFTYPFKLNENIEDQVDALVKAVKKDAPRALELSPGPRVVFIDPVSLGAKTFAAVVSLLVTLVVALWEPLRTAIHAAVLAEAARTIFLILFAALIYNLLTARFKLK
ncbi:MAG: hypothetical protein M3347_13445 [Armatimonadota bacterium]|nr:hypothetical protein [Armatimonadota bacterium]